MTTMAKANAMNASESEAMFVGDVLRAEAEALTRIADRAAASDRTSWTASLDLLEKCDGHVVVSGMGKSGLVGAKISATFSSLGQPSNVLHPAEAVHGDLGRVRRGDVVLLLSYSGSTEEVVNLALILKADDVPTIGISKTHDTTLAKACTAHLATGDVTEACPLNLAPTTSTTAQLAIGDSLALALSRRRNFTADDFHRSHPGGMLGVGLRRITEALRFRVGVNLPVVSDQRTVGDALKEVHAAAEASDSNVRRAGAILLVDGDGVLSGLFTDGDLHRLLVEDADSALAAPIAEVMTPRPKHLTADALVRDAERLIRQHRVDEIPVLDLDGRPIGLVDVQDLIAMKAVREG